MHIEGYKGRGIGSSFPKGRKMHRDMNTQLKFLNFSNSISFPPSSPLEGKRGWPSLVQGKNP
jgi:hypothetical protein